MIAKITFDFKDLIKRKNKINLNVNHQIGNVASKELIEEVQRTTWPYVPFLHGQLGGMSADEEGTPASGFWYSITKTGSRVTAHMQYSAYNYKDHFNYAEIQHDNLKYNHRARVAGKRPLPKYMWVGVNLVQFRYTERIITKNLLIALK